MLSWEFLLWLSGNEPRLVSMRMQVRSLASLSGFKDPKLLWLWHWQAATALIQPLAWEFLYTVGAALKRKKNLSITDPLLEVFIKKNNYTHIGLRN